MDFSGESSDSLQIRAFLLTVHIRGVWVPVISKLQKCRYTHRNNTYEDISILD